MKSDQKQNTRLFYFAATAISFIGLLLRLKGLQKGLWLDEIFTVNVVRVSSVYKMLAILRYDIHPPFYYLLLRGWISFYDSDPSIRLFSALFGTLTVPVTIWWLKDRSFTASLLAGLYVATLPVMLRYSQEIRMYSLLMFLFAVALLVSARLVRTPEEKKNYILLALILCLAVATQLTAILLVIPLWSYLLLSVDRKKIHPGYALSTFAGPCFVCIFCFFFFSAFAHHRPNWMPALSFKLVLSTAKYLSGYFSVASHGRLLFLAATFFLLVGSWRLSLPFWVPVFLFIAEILVCSWIVTPIFMFYLFLPILILFAGFAGTQIATIRWSHVRFIAIICFISICILFSYNWAEHESEKDMEGTKAIAQTLQVEQPLPDRIIFYPSWLQMTIEYYFSDLPKEKSIDFNPDISPNDLTTNLDRSFSVLQARPARIFLVLRDDPLEMKHPAILPLFLTRMKSYNLRPAIIEVACMRNAGRAADSGNFDQRHREILSLLERNFGKPVTLKNFDNYSFSTYEVR